MWNCECSDSQHEIRMRKTTKPPMRAKYQEVGRGARSRRPSRASAAGLAARTAGPRRGAHGHRGTDTQPWQAPRITREPRTEAVWDQLHGAGRARHPAAHRHAVLPHTYRSLRRGARYIRHHDRLSGSPRNARGFLARQPSAADRRSRAVALTPEGRRLVDEAIAVRFAEAGEAIALMSASERRTLGDVTRASRNDARVGLTTCRKKPLEMRAWVAVRGWCRQPRRLGCSSK